jgi:HD-GYP domain-containing protein (c-di-GMP phosphodiesterase class II)
LAAKKKKNVKSDFRRVYENEKLHALLTVGTALASERETPKILDMIITLAQQNSGADGASVYLVEKVSQDSLGGTRPSWQTKLRFHKMINNTGIQVVPSLYLPIDNKSIAGYAAQSGRTVRIRDCYVIDPHHPFHFLHDLDKSNGYRTKSILAVPIKTSKGKVLGVLQLVNKLRDKTKKRSVYRLKESEIIAFSEHDAHLVEAFAAHAAVALENTKLTQDIENLFESFVKASVTAIEARDPTTSGHSDRVAIMTVEFAKTLDKLSSGTFSAVTFSKEQIQEIRYAALLHDFGKIGVRENLLVKGKKLFPHELETLLLRLDSMKSLHESRQWRDTLQNVIARVSTGQVANIEAELGTAMLQVNGFNQQIEQIRVGIMKANESQILDRDFNVKKLLEWIENTSRNLGVKLVTEDEYQRLSIARGTLTAKERKEIESHVSHTFEFLRQIAWTEDLSGVPDIAHAHHEKMDGTGYPLGLKADKIPVQSRMMAIVDIYDALTAMDRPYKKSVSTERAIEILGMESGEGKLDKELLKIFVEAQIYQSVVGVQFKKNKAG